MGIIENFEAMLANGQDSALLRFSLGQAYLKEERFEEAGAHLEKAVAQNPKYSAAWKLYGKALAALGQNDAAMMAYENGIACAEETGDVQAAKEMQVFLKRLKKQARGGADPD
jgi:predicted Zn-dependent protease